MTPQAIVEEIITAYGNRDLDTVLAHTSDTLHFKNNAAPGIAPHVADTQTKADFLAYMSEIDDCWQIDRFELQQIIANGQDVATRSRLDYTSKSTGKQVLTEAAHFWHVEDGAVTKIVEFYDTAAIGHCK